MFASKKPSQSMYRGVAAALAAFAFLAGCELAVDFDRSKIPTPQSDGSAPIADASLDTGSVTDAAPTDAATDTGTDATATDAASDAKADSTTDAASDAADSGSDASDAATD